VEHDLGERVSHPRGGATAPRNSRSRCATASSTSSTAIDAGLDVDEFAPRISFFFNAHNDFFEEIAKYRAARASGRDVMRDRFGAKDERSWKLRFHTQTAGVSLTAQQPYNNVVRTAPSRRSRPCSAAPTRCTPTRSTRRCAADRRGRDARAAHAADHRARERRGERRRSARRVVARRAADEGLEEEAYTYFDTIDRMGGMVAAIEQGFPQRKFPRAPIGSSRPSKRARRSSSAPTRSSPRGRAAGPHPLHRRGRRRAAARQAPAAEGGAQQRRRAALARRAEARRGGLREHDAAARGRGAQLRHGRRDVRRAARRVGRVGGDAGDLSGTPQAAGCRLRAVLRRGSSARNRSVSPEMVWPVA
jgi:hypothetical protein